MIKIEKETVTSEGSLDLLATEVTLGVLHVWGLARLPRAGTRNRRRADGCGLQGL